MEENLANRFGQSGGISRVYTTLNDIWYDFSVEAIVVNFKRIGSKSFHRRRI